MSSKRSIRVSCGLAEGWKRYGSECDHPAGPHEEILDTTASTTSVPPSLPRFLPSCCSFTCCSTVVDISYRAVKELYEPLLPLIPRPFDEDPDTFMIFGWEDAPTRVVSHENLQQSQDLADEGLTWDSDTLYHEERTSLWSYGW